MAEKNKCFLNKNHKQLWDQILNSIIFYQKSKIFNCFCELLSISIYFIIQCKSFVTFVVEFILQEQFYPKLHRSLL